MGSCCIGDCCVMNNSVGDFFRDIFGSSGGGYGYHPGPSETEAHAKKIADELAEMKENVRKSSEKKETQIIEYLNKSMNALIQELDKINKQTYGGKSLNININGIKEKNESLKKNVIGCIGDIMEERLVLTDKELSVILEERDDKKRAKNFDAFCKKIQKQALDGLSKEIESTVRKQQDMIRQEIQNRLSEVDRSMKQATQAYMSIMQAKEKYDAKIEKMQVEYIYKCGLAEIILDQLEK